MAIVLGTTTLNPNMVWVDRFEFAPVFQEVQTTLDGYPVVYSRAQRQGRPITLRAIDDGGWLTLEQLQAVQSSANTPGATLGLTIGGEEFTVVFRHHNAPAVQFAPIIPRAVPLPGDWFVGEIKLMTL